MAFEDNDKVIATVKPADIISPEAPQGELDGAMSVPLPPELAGKPGIRVHDTLETNPTVKFQVAGDYVLGRYQGLRSLVIDGRNQAVYDIKTPSGVIVSVWGSTILNGRMSDAIKAGLTQGASLMIQYLGDIDTGRPSAAHNFRVAWK